MHFKKQTFIFCLAYFALRIFSFFFSPDTPLYNANPVNSALAGLVLIIAVYFLIKKDVRGWLIIAGEIILGGGGGYLAIQNISLRTWLLVASLAIYTLQNFKDIKILDIRYLRNKNLISNIQYLISILLIWTGLTAILGFYSGHNLKLIFSDFIPYLFLLYYFPLRELWTSDRFKQTVWPMVLAALWGNAVFILFTFGGFSSGLFALQDAYYHWFRDAAGGKITDLGFNFYRLILNEHLLLVPLLLLFLQRCLSFPRRRESRHWIPDQVGDDKLIIIALLTTLSINFTRIYFVALFVGLIFLFSQQNWKKWLLYSAGTLILLFGSFTALHLAASRGQSLGWELWGLRLQSVVSPQIEESSLSRMLLLPKIWEKIKTHPLWGEGLGAVVTVYSPALKQTITTPHFDWGYLEIIAEMGLVGLVIWLSLIAYLLFLLKKRDGDKNKFLLASLVGLLVINLTSPALFHVLGIIWLVLTLVKITSNHVSAAPPPAPPRSS